MEEETTAMVLIEIIDKFIDWSVLEMVVDSIDDPNEVVVAEGLKKTSFDIYTKIKYIS